MNRTTRLKLATLVLILVLASLAGFALNALRMGTPWLVAIVIALLVPGRVQGMLWREFFIGRRLLANGQYAEAIPHFERFMEQLKERPNLRHAVWLGWSVYTLKPDVMALTNIGACNLMLGKHELAESALKEAIGRDPLAPLPHFNLALLHQLRNNPSEAERYLALTRSLGYRGAWNDAVVQHAMNAYASAEGCTNDSAATGKKMD
jgi:tetratricopeptide (TPR) repeat protein